jgi:hypothetical protein
MRAVEASSRSLEALVLYTAAISWIAVAAPAGAQSCPAGYVLGTDGQCWAAAPPVETSVPSPSFLFRAAASLGYGHFFYTSTSRNGGGPSLGVSATFAYRLPSGVFFGGSAGFEPILAASGSHGDGGTWGPLFTPGGYAGGTVGYAGGMLELDGTLAFGGAGNGTGAGGFGLYVVPNATFVFVENGPLHVGAFLRPAIGLLSDPNGGRFVAYVNVAAGMSLTLR